MKIAAAVFIAIGVAAAIAWWILRLDERAEQQRRARIRAGASMAAQRAADELAADLRAWLRYEISADDFNRRHGVTVPDDAPVPADWIPAAVSIDIPLDDPKGPDQ